MTVRLTSEFWIAAYLARLRQADIPAFIVARGDGTAGAILVKQSALDGTATLFQRSFDPETGLRKWMVLSSGQDADIDAAASRQREFDPDLWVIEVEDRSGRHLLDEPGLE